MLRYLRLYGHFVRFSLSTAMEFRFDFYFRVLMDLVYYAVNLAFYRVIFLHTPVLGGWNESQAMVFVAGYLVVDAISMTLFSDNLWWFPYYVNRGDLDYYLTRPVSSLFFLSLRSFAANSFMNFLFAVGILVWAIARYPEPITAGRLVLFAALLLNGAFLHYLVRMMLMIPVFWTHSARGFEQVFWTMSRFIERPDRIFTGWVRKLLVSALPFCLMASYPARMVLEAFRWNTLAHVLGVTGIFFLALLAFWQVGLRAYSSASS